MNKQIDKVDAECLEITGDQAYLLDGVPFNGTAVHYRSNGSTESELEFRDGIQNGLVRDWNVNGQLIFEGEMRNGVYHGTCNTWNDSGQLVEEEKYEYGIKTSHKKWSGDGTLVGQSELAEGDPNYELLQSSRRAFEFENETE
ncbi:MAG: hypothetical protein AAFV88_24595 [Planctomycetota bacterium]